MGNRERKGDDVNCLKHYLTLWDIPLKDLKKIQMYISLNKKDIIYEWFRHFNQ